MFPQTQLIEEAVKLLEIPDEIIRNTIEQEVLDGTLVQEAVENEIWLYLVRLYKAEVNLAKAIQWVEVQTGLALAPSQREAITLDTPKSW